MPAQVFVFTCPSIYSSCGKDLTLICLCFVRLFFSGQLTTLLQTVVPGVAVTGAASNSPVIAGPQQAPSTLSPTRISRGGIAAAVIMSIFGFLVVLWLVWYFLLGGNKEEAEESDYAVVQQDGFEGGSKVAQPGAQSDHGRV